MRFPGLPLLSKAHRAVVEFNLEHPVGTMVRYWLMEKRGMPNGTARTRSRAELLGGRTAVVWLEGIRGCVALSHVEVIEESSSPSGDGAKTEIVHYGAASD